MSRLKSSFELAMAGGASFKASAPNFQIVDRRSSWSANTLIESATQNQDRGSVTMVDQDFHRTVSVFGRRTLMSLGRTMFWRVPALQASILEQTNLAVCPFTRRYVGRNAAWGDMAEEYLLRLDDQIDLAGWPYDGQSLNEQLVTAPIVDGDVAIILTEDDNGSPRIQIVGSHRIGNRLTTQQTAKVMLTGREMWIDGKLVETGLQREYSPAVEWNAQVIDGCIVDGTRRAMAYRVYADSESSGEFQDISARSMFLAFLPTVPDQCRGISVLASSIFDWQDVREFRRFEMLAQKAFSTKGITEFNESGQATGATKRLVSRAGFTTSEQVAATDTFPAINAVSKTSLTTEQLDGGAYTYFKSNSGSKLEAFNWGDRPGRSTQDFMAMTIRDAMRGTEWDAFFSLDAGAVGGASMRVIVDRINRTLQKRRRLVAKCKRRIDPWAIAKAIKNGLLPFDPDFWKWDYSGPPNITADRRYDAQTDQMEYELGWSTMEDIEARRQGDWIVKRQQKEIEVRDLYARAATIATEFGITIQEAAAQLSKGGVTAPAGQGAPRQQADEEAPPKPGEPAE